MGKFTAIQTYDRFTKLKNANKINERSLNFILDTGQLYTHGIFLNNVAWGTETTGAVELTIAGVKKTLSLSNHTHSNYLEKNANIDLGAYKIVSGTKDLLYYSSGNTYLGNTSSPLILQGSSGSIKKGDTTYTILDTLNFTILAVSSAGHSLQNAAKITYGSSNFQIDYIKRLNTTLAFNDLNAYSSAGVTLTDSKYYAFITLRNDGSDTASWAQVRFDIASKTMQYRTSAASTTWYNVITSIPSNALNVAGIVAAPTSSDANKVWKTDASGNPGWKDDTNTWRNVRINDSSSDALGTGTGSGALYIKQGSGISVTWENNKIVIANTSQNVWKAANTSQEGYVPKLVTGGGTISTQSTEYVLTYVSSGSGTVVPVWKLLPNNAFLNDNTWTAADLNNAGYVPKSIKGKFLHANASTGALEWVDDANTQYYLTLNGTVKGTSGTNDLGTFYAIPTSDASAANQVWMRNADNNGYAWRTLGSRAFDSTSYLPLSGGTLTGNITFSGNNNITWSRNTDYARISFKNDSDGDTDSYMSFTTGDNGNEYFRFDHAGTEWATIKSDGIRVKGTLVSLNGHTHSYLPLSGGTLTGNLTINATNHLYFPNDGDYTHFYTGGTSEHFSIGYGRILGYASMYINADTDGSTSEVLLLTAGRGVTTDISLGLKVGYDSLTWLGNNVLTAGNYSSYALPLSGGTMSGDINMNNHSITNLKIGEGIYWNPYVESSSDPSDTAYIKVVSSGVAGGTTLIIGQENDANDTIQFVTNGSATLYHNSQPIITGANIGSLSVSYANNSDTLDGYHYSSFLRYNGEWDGSDSTLSVDNATDMIFVYSTHGAPGTWGVLSTFANSLGSSYNTQIFGDGWNNELYFRTRSADNGLHNWKHLLDSVNYSSYAVPLSGGTMTGDLVTTGVTASGSSNRLQFRYLDGLNCGGDYALYLNYYTAAPVYLCGSSYYINSSGYFNGAAASSTIWNRTWQRGNDCNVTPSDNQTRIYMYDGSTSNRPTSAAGFMIVNGWDWGAGGSILAQDFDEGVGRLYVKAKSCEGNWSNWSTVALTSDISNYTYSKTESDNRYLPVTYSLSGSSNTTLTVTGNINYLRMLRIMSPNLSVGYHNDLLVGVSDSSYNTALFGFYYAGANSQSNFVYFGMHSVDDQFIINGYGNIGIGTTSPSYKLDVNGTARVRDSLIVSSNNSTGGGIILADDGDIVDLNDGYAAMRFSSGVRIYSANRGGSWQHELSSNGVLYNYGVYHRSYGSPDYFLTSDGGVKYMADIGIYTKTITVTGDSNTYYPVKIPASGDKRRINTISVWKNLGSTTASYSGNHSNGTSSCWYEFIGRGNAWDGNGGYYYTRRSWYGYAQLLSHAQAPGGPVGELFVWLRGGGTEYNISTNYPISDPTIYYSRSNASGSDTYPSYVEPRTDIGNEGILGKTYYGDITGNADTVDGLHIHSGRNYEANKLVRTDGSGYIQAGYINSSSGDENNNSSPARVWGTNGSDSYLRTYRTSALSVNYANSAGSPYGFSFSDRSSSDWTGVPGTFIADWSHSSGADIMFKYNGGALNVITDGYFYQGIDYRGASYRVLDEYDITHTNWGNADTVDGYHYNNLPYLSTSGGTLTGTLNVNNSEIWINGSSPRLVLHYPDNSWANISMSGGAIYFNAANNSSSRCTIYAGDIYSNGVKLTNSSGSSFNGYIDEINSTDGNGMLGYHRSDWTGVTSSQWAVGAINSQGVIRSNNSPLLHYKGGTSYLIVDGSGGTASSGEQLDQHFNLIFASGSGYWHIDDSSNNTIFIVQNNNSSGGYYGRVGVGTTSLSYKLHVNGDCGATAFYQTSDMRIKNVLDYIQDIPLTAITNSPLFKFTWLDESLDTNIHIGSSAQYWKSILPEAVTKANDNIGTLSLQYDVLALACVISIAKETLDNALKIIKLENRIKELEEIVYGGNSN